MNKNVFAICLTALLIVSECLLVDLIKFSARAELVSEAARALNRYHAAPPVQDQALENL